MGLINSRPWVVVSGRSYRVAAGPKNKQMEAAEQLARLHKKLDRLVNAVIGELGAMRVPSYVVAPMQNLVKVYPSVVLYEYNPTGKQPVAFNENKRQINLCLDNVTDEGLVYVGVHELAHCATSKYDPQDMFGVTAHSKEFAVVLAYLYKQSEILEIIRSGGPRGARFCGITL